MRRTYVLLVALIALTIPSFASTYPNLIQSAVQIEPGTIPAHITPPVEKNYVLPEKTGARDVLYNPDQHKLSVSDLVYRSKSDKLSIQNPIYWIDKDRLRVSDLVLKR